MYEDEIKNMYDDPAVAERFADQEQNPDHQQVAAIVDDIIALETAGFVHPLRIAELGGGAHTDRYDRLFEKLLPEPGRGRIDWVDASASMIELADEYLEDDRYQTRNQVITFVHKDMLAYLESMEDCTLDCAIMKYTLNYLSDNEIELLFQLLKRKLKTPGRLITTVSSPSGVLQSHNQHARFIYRGEEIPLGETRKLGNWKDLYTTDSSARDLFVMVLRK